MRRDDPFDDIFRELERMMDGMMGNATGVTPFTAVDNADPSPPSDAHIDIHDMGDAICVIADIPGVERPAINLQCDGSRLRIAAAGSYRE